MSRQRAVRQQLEDLRRAGVTHISAETAKQLVAAVTELSPTEKPTASTTTRGPVAKAPAAPARSVPTRPVLAPTTPTRSVSTPTVAAPVVAMPVTPRVAAPVRSGCSLSREERITQLQDLAKGVSQCTRCAELARTRTQTVFGVGNPEATILFIGEAPGAEEDAQGEPFVGPAGQKLNDIMRASKLTREEVYICNILRCRPPGNRTPAPTEAANCREHLDAQIATINPQWIICWGSVAAQNLLNTKTPIGKLRGVFHDYKGIKVLCTYHPSYLLRYEPAKKDVWQDMKFFRAAQGVIL